MCANRKRDMPFSLSMMTVTTALVMIAAMEMDNISQKPVLSTVMSIEVSIEVSIGTEIISDSESHAYSADHPGHSKFNNSFNNRQVQGWRAHYTTQA